MRQFYIWSSILLLFFAGCGGSSDDSKQQAADSASQQTPATTSSPPADSAPTPATPAQPPAGGDHGESTPRGALQVADYTFEVTQIGTLAPGTEGAFELRLAQNDASINLSQLNVYVWVEDTQGKQLSAPSKGTVESGALHFHVAMRQNSQPPARVVVRLRSEGVDTRESLPLDHHGHEHAQTPHDGVLATLQSVGKVVGYLELKLHDDKGDLELWLARDQALSEPLDIPLETPIQVTFIDVDDKKVEMRVRNTATNEDETGTPTIREGRTNYFIYPSQEGEDASWLQGADFQSIVQLTFEVDGTTYTSEEFVLVPHTHASGH